MRCFFALLTIFAVFSCAHAIGRMQSTAVKGIVTCNGKVQSGIKMKLYSHGTLTSDRMGQTVSLSDGSFFINGHKSKFTTITPELKFYHKCGRTFFEKCSKIRIPKSYITDGASPQTIFDAGIIKLETMTSNC